MARSKTHKRRYKGGDNERISKLRNVMAKIFYYYATKLHIRRFQSVCFEIFGGLKLKIPKDFSITQLLNHIELHMREECKAYKIFPPNILSNAYIIQIDTELKKISEMLNALKINNPEDYDDFEEEHYELTNEMTDILYDRLYVKILIDRFENEEDINFSNDHIMPELYNIYDIKESYDDSYKKYTEEEYEAKKDIIRKI